MHQRWRARRRRRRARVHPALIAAMSGSSTASLRTLIRRGADLKRVPNEGYFAPVHWAALNGDPLTAKALADAMDGSERDESLGKREDLNAVRFARLAAFAPRSTDLHPCPRTCPRTSRAVFRRRKDGARHPRRSDRADEQIGRPGKILRRDRLLARRRRQGPSAAPPKATSRPV